LIEGVNNNRTIEAKAGEVVQIIGADNKVAIRGNVSKLIIEGKGNMVTGNDIAAITIEGSDNMVNIGVGFVAAFIAALLVVKALVLFVERHTLRVVAWYRIVLGVIILIAAMFFNLSA